MSEEKFNFLGEEYDFIEESTSFSSAPLDFTEVNETIISESSGEKSPYKILGRVCGCFAPVGAYSRNRRLYENDHWEYVLNNLDLQERLKNRRIFGELGHAQKKVDDASNKAGDISHIVTKMEIREDNNGTPFLYGEFEILDTPAGRILEAMYKGGAGLYVSSRAAGKLKPMTGNPGMSVVLKESYYLHSWDVVLEPGFLQAKPTFEAVDDTSKQLSPNIQESTNMERVFDLDDKINKVEKIRKEERAKLTAGEGKPYSEVAKAQARVEQADNLLKRLNKSREEAMSEDVQTLKSQVEQLTKILEKMVEDVYEPANEEEETPTNMSAKESLANFIVSLVNSNISEQAFTEILEMIAPNKQNVEKAMKRNEENLKGAIDELNADLEKRGKMDPELVNKAEHALKKKEDTERRAENKFNK